MRPVSQDFKDAFLKVHPDVKNEVSYKRRYWDAASQSYVWEGSWTTIPADQVSYVSPITEQLDTERLNEFKVSNITLTLKNKDNRWRSDNPAGIFGPDSVSPLYKYSEYWTKFRVRIGARLLDGTYEYTSRFVGLAVEYTSGSQDEIQVTVQGLESLLQKANAENVSTRVVGENVGTGNGVTVAFTTANPGVGIIEEVSVAGIAVVAGSGGYSVSDLNSQSLGATITFDAAPASGTIRVTYRYWQQGQTVEALIADLLTEAGIAGGSQIIDPVIFPGGVSNQFVVDLQAEWLNGTLSGVEGAIFPGDIKLDFDGASELIEDFSDGDYTVDPVWTAATNYSSNPWSVVGTDNLRVLVPTVAAKSRISTPKSAVVGEWKSDIDIRILNGGYFMFVFMASSINTSSGPLNAYAVKLSLSGSNRVVSLVRTNGSGSQTVLASVNLAPAFTGTYKVVRQASGRMLVYRDGTLLIDHTSTVHVTSSVMGFYQSTNTVAATDYNYVDNIYAPTDTITGSYTSQAFDASASLTNFGKILETAAANGGTITISTRTSTDGMSWDAWVEIQSNGTILSDLKRYIQVKIEMECASSAMNDPTVSAYVLNYSTATTTIGLANFTGKTVYQAIQNLGQFSNYEWGFTPDEDFFFRSKSVQKVAVFTLEKGKNLSEISGLVTGQDRVYNEVRATYGDFTARVKGADDTEGAAGTKFGSNILTIDGGDILAAEDANVAIGVAAIFAADFSKAKRRMRVSGKISADIELSDVGLVTFDQNVPLPTWFHGDTNVTLGGQSFQHYGPKEQVVSGMYVKVVGTRIDPYNFKTELELQEVL